MSADYSLAQAATRAGATVHQLRTYVSCGLVKPCARTAAGHHRFNDDCVARLRLIVAATGAGLRIAEIGGLIRAIECGARDDVAVARRMLVVAIEDRQAALRSLAGMLSSACGPVAAEAAL
jgi:DNA-binding transcriptional MerR regulator